VESHCEKLLSAARRQIFWAVGSGPQIFELFLVCDFELSRVTLDVPIAMFPFLVSGRLKMRMGVGGGVGRLDLHWIHFSSVDVPVMPRLRSARQTGYTPFGFADVDWISCMSPWCTVAT
jgi:hypothetical protein